MSFYLRWGLSEELRLPAAKLIYDTFERKFRYLLSPRDKGISLIANSINPDYGLVVLQNDELVGIGGAKDIKGELIQVGLNTWLRTYHIRVFQIMVVSGLFWFRRVQPNVLWVDNLSVVASAQGQGIGTKMIQEFIRYGRERGYRTLKLEVINANMRAKALYEHIGFEITEYTAVPLPWSHLLGFTGFYRMTYSLV